MRDLFFTLQVCTRLLGNFIVFCYELQPNNVMKCSNKFSWIRKRIKKKYSKFVNKTGFRLPVWQWLWRASKKFWTLAEMFNFVWISYTLVIICCSFNNTYSEDPYKKLNTPEACKRYSKEFIIEKDEEFFEKRLMKLFWQKFIRRNHAYII